MSTREPRSNCLFGVFATLLLVTGTGLIAVVWAFVFWVKNLETAPPARPHVRPSSSYVVRGVDVSHHQGAIDWNRVAASGDVQFAWMKATEGVSHTDRRFKRNWRDARKANVLVGAYHFYSMCRGGAAQAAHFIETVPKESNALPPAVDVEADGRCNRVPPANLQVELTAFMDKIEAHYGVRPVLYSTSSYIGAHLDDPDEELWLAGYSRSPRRDWLFWQFTDRGRVDGIAGPVDLNVYRLSASDLQAFVSGGSERASR